RCVGGRHRRGAGADRRAPARPAPLSRVARGPAALADVRRVGVDTFPASFVDGGTLMAPPVPAGPFTTLPLTAFAPPRPRPVWKIWMPAHGRVAAGPAITTLPVTALPLLSWMWMASYVSGGRPGPGMKELPAMTLSVAPRPSPKSTSARSWPVLPN